MQMCFYGRGYRNRTYTKGVRGPCATTTPSPTDVDIIFLFQLKHKQTKAFWKFCSLTFHRRWDIILSVNYVKSKTRIWNFYQSCNIVTDCGDCLCYAHRWKGGWQPHQHHCHRRVCRGVFIVCFGGYGRHDDTLLFQVQLLQYGVQRQTFSSARQYALSLQATCGLPFLSQPLLVWARDKIAL